MEGVFTQGLGLVTLEQCVYLEGNQRTQRGMTFTTGPGTYKIPSSSVVPVELNVSLLDRSPNPKAIFSSKVRRKGLAHNILMKLLSSYNILMAAYSVELYGSFGLIVKVS